MNNLYGIQNVYVQISKVTSFFDISKCYHKISQILETWMFACTSSYC